MIDNRYPKEAVIILLHVDYTKFLLQLRDFKPSIPFPGVWGGFGGQIEKGESPNVEMLINPFASLKHSGFISFSVHYQHLHYRIIF